MSQELKELIKERRPKISDSSIRTYTSLLLNLNKKINEGKDNYIQIFNKKSKEVIIEYINENINSPQSKKTLLSALYIITGLKDYHTSMIEHAQSVNNYYKQNKIAPNREEQKGVKVEDLQAKYDEYKKRLDKNPTIENYIDYFVVAFTSTKLMPPRRNLDVISIKLNKTTDNYIDAKGNFIFNKFKTAKFNQDPDSLERKLPVPKEMLKYINRFKKINDKSDYLLFHERNGSPFSKKLQSIYGEGITIDVIRSIFVSNLYKGLPQLQKLEDIASSMGHTVSSALTYYNKPSGEEDK
jgi:hypothetical protein